MTARDLLSYIAHRDPETKRYFFGEEALNTLEETLGQLIGYVCTALFPTLQIVQQGEAVPTHPHVTEPLPSTVLQDA